MMLKGNNMSISEIIALQSAEEHIKTQSKITKTVQSNFIPPIQEVYYNPELDKMEFSRDIQNFLPFEPNYENIYEGCTEDIRKAFGLDLPGTPYEIEDLTPEMKTSIKDKLVKKLNTTEKYANCKIYNADIVKPLAEDFKEFLKAVEYSKCFYIKDKAGVERGVQPPKTIRVQFGLCPVPWKFIYIDFKAQRDTDIAHIIDKFLDYDSYRNMGARGRMDKTTGKRVDINDGRHSAFLLALTGIDMCPVSGIISDKRSMNMIVFMITNSLAKPVELFDELKVIKGKAELEKDEGGLKNVETKEYTLSSGSKIRTSDRQVYEIFSILEQFGIQPVPQEYGKNNRKLVKQGNWYRLDMLIKFFQDSNYTKYKSSPDLDAFTIDDSSFIFDALYIIKEVIVSKGGYAPHELIWAILELFRVINEQNGMSKKDRSNIRDYIIIALENWLQAYNPNAPTKMLKERSYEFYDAYTNKAKGRIPTNHPIWSLAQSGNTYVHYFLATGLYSIVQECKLLKKTQKALFVAPQVKWTVNEADGSETKYNSALFDDRNLPFSFDESFKNNIKTKQKKMSVIVADDGEDDDSNDE
jgi:hypothetical protein